MSQFFNKDFQAQFRKSFACSQINWQNQSTLSCYYCNKAIKKTVQLHAIDNLGKHNCNDYFYF